MCRMAARIGSSAPLSSLVYDAPHGLERQSYLPRELLSGHVNVDGTGVAWWPRRGAGEPLLYRTELPPWADGNLLRLLPRIEAEVEVALVRSATPGQGHGEQAVGPFVGGGLAVAHNGFVERWNERAKRPLLAALDDDLFAASRAGTDSELLFLHVLQARRGLEGAALETVVAAALRRVGDELQRLDLAARLDVLVSDGIHVLAVRWALGLDSNSIYVRHGAGGTVFASEPLDPSSRFVPLEPGHWARSDGAELRSGPLT